MDNTYKPLLPNHKIKTFRVKSDDKYFEDNRIYEIFSNIRKNNFQSWLNSPLKQKYLNNNRKWKGKYMYNNNNELIIVKSYINEFINSLVDLLKKNGHSINNYKLFRDTVASYIYKLSKQ